MDLTPRTGGSDPLPRRKRRWAPVVIVVLALVAGGVVVTQFLTSAIDYYCNVDEVGVRQGCDTDRRIRVQGVVRKDSVRKSDGATAFELTWHDRTVEVRYLGDPGGVFQECIAVVAHGRVRNGVLDSDRIEVKHSNEYVEKNETRFDEADDEAAACSLSEG
ncbi:MAG: cytochrome c maturation protein CcmE [Acidimicrobiales bacterium]